MTDFYEEMRQRVVAEALVRDTADQRAELIAQYLAGFCWRDPRPWRQLPKSARAEAVRVARDTLIRMMDIKRVGL